VATAVTISYLETPIGKLLLAVTQVGVVRVAFPEEEPAAILEQISRSLGPEVELSEGETPGAGREIERYFAGELRTFRSPVDLSLVPAGFPRRVLQATAAIPYGRTATYGEMAEEAGSPRGARAAGNALNANPVPLLIPCHRVVPASGGIGGYAGREDRKAALLRLEGAIRP
jgi:methylated-DNA-[protein]-cysteine S-methyltransferase